MCNLTYRRLHLAPLHRPRHALDIGTGTGIWAMDFGKHVHIILQQISLTQAADQYPKCEVIGIDLSPGQPTLLVYGVLSDKRNLLMT